MKTVVIHASDHVAVAPWGLAAQQPITIHGFTLVPQQNIPAGHKLCIRPVQQGQAVFKYGYSIGLATRDIQPGEWVHTHNLKTGLGGMLEYTYQPDFQPLTPREPTCFSGFLRGDGTVGIRNEVWIIPTVGCINTVAQALAARAPSTKGVDGVYAFPHPYGCSQLGSDHQNTQKALCGLIRHPNAAGVLVLGLGCENNQISDLRQMLGEYDPRRVKFLNTQDCADELAEGTKLLEELCCFAADFHRTPQPISKLVVGLKCGGSDGLSGLTANPLLGDFSDWLVSQGGTTLLTEVPEMFGAETILMNRCIDRGTFDKTVALINHFKGYFLSYGQKVYENPSPGNKEGGITTLEEKSLGCTQKGGRAPVTDVLSYGDPVRKKGLNLLQAPGNDLVASTAQVVAGAQLILFTTGRGTPFGSPVPTLKISSNSALAARKPNWIDFDAGRLMTGHSFQLLLEEFTSLILEIAGGSRQSLTEILGARELAIFKDGVTL